MSSVLLEARAFRPFKSSEEYLYAMKEDLAEWLQTMYPHLNIATENFMERLETGVALCEHANSVKAQAIEYVEKKQARMTMTKSITGVMLQAQQLIRIPDVKYFTTAKPGTFFARDNVSNFINWCRFSLEIIECLLFESDDLIMRKNEKHVILCLLEVARRGARFGMLAPMLVQMERQIDREIAADQRKLGFTDNDIIHQALEEDDDSDMEDEEPMMMYGPVPQIITNDLKSLDEMVRDLVEKCTCPTQFPMIRVSEGKYRIGDTKVLIFVRILRKHVMVRVGGGWDTLSHYLDKHDPCRCKAQHRPTLSANLVRGNNKPDLHGAQVYYDRSNASPASLPPTINGTTGTAPHHTLGPPMNALNRSRSRSPSHANTYMDTRRSVSPNFPRKNLVPPPNRSRSPTPNYTSTHVTRLSALNGNKSPQHKPVLRESNLPHGALQSGPQSLPFISSSPPSKHVSSLQIPVENSKVVKTEASLHVNDGTDHSDTTSEMSDEGYRSLGIVQDKNKKRSSVYSQNSAEDVEENEHQQVYTDDELNDFGLRKTNFSQRIYDPDAKITPRKTSPERKLSLADLKPSHNLEKHGSPTSESPRHLLMNGDSKMNGHYHQELDMPARSFKYPQLKEKSFSEERPSILRRASSTELRSDGHHKISPHHSPKKTVNGTIKKQNQQDSKINTWNGRPKTSRPSLSQDTFTTPFQRNTNGRRSVSAVSERRTSASANTSPTKSRLRQELLNAVKKADDDETIALQVQQLLKKYGSLSTLDQEENYTSPPVKPFTRLTTERVSYRSPRKDSRPEVASRIPAPKFTA